jgi:hypothetical protein
MANKITEREIYNSILNGTADQAVLCEFAEKKLAQLDKRNASAARRAQAKRAEGDAITERVFSVVSAEPMTREAITAALGDETLSVAKIGARLNHLVKTGRVSKETAKIQNAEGKTAAKVVYFVAE